MGTITKVYTPGDIFEGAANLYLGITAPASSLSPTSDANTLELDSTGEPSSSTGFFIGLLDPPTNVAITEKVNEIMADQFDGPVDVAFDSLSAEIDFVMKETNLSRLQQMINGGNLAAYNAITGEQVLQVGGQQSTVVGATTLLMVAPQRLNASKFIQVLAYKVVLEFMPGMSFVRSKESVYKVKAKCLADTTRVAGDEILQIVKDQ